MRNLEYIFITHNHADHHLGLLSFLERRHSIDPTLPPIHILAPPVIHSWLSEYSEISSLFYNFTPFNTPQFVEFQFVFFFILFYSLSTPLN